MNRISVAACATFMLTTGVAIAQPQNNRCLRVGQIDGFSAIKGNEKALVVTDLMHRRFRLTLNRVCGGLDYNEAVKIVSRGVGRMACVAAGDTVVSRDPIVAGSRCQVSRVELYTREMERADTMSAAMQRVQERR